MNPTISTRSTKAQMYAEIERLRAECDKLRASTTPVVNANRCTRCGGTGQHPHGTCFTCEGTGRYPGKYEARIRYALNNRNKVRPVVAKHFKIAPNEVTVGHVRAWCARD